jgi:pimeloyl-ACP methyl ester carboxylesterase
VYKRQLFHHDFGVCDRYAGGMQAAAAVRCPVSFIVGEYDQMTSPKLTREIATALNAQVHHVPAGHALMQEVPESVLTLLRKALG